MVQPAPVKQGKEYITIPLFKPKKKLLRWILEGPTEEVILWAGEAIDTADLGKDIRSKSLVLPSLRSMEIMFSQQEIQKVDQSCSSGSRSFESFQHMQEAVQSFSQVWDVF